MEPFVALVRNVFLEGIVAEQLGTANGIRYVLKEDAETNATFNLIVKFMNSVGTKFV